MKNAGQMRTEKWACGQIFWAIAHTRRFFGFFAVEKVVKWPKKVGFWPLFKEKVANFRITKSRKNSLKLTKNGQKSVKMGQKWPFFVQNNFRMTNIGQMATFYSY